MRAPRLHLNGTGAKALLDGYQAAHVAINAALDALQQTAPHARDYYVYALGNDALREAVEEHHARMDKLRDVLTELRNLYQHVDNQQHTGSMWARQD